METKAHNNDGLATQLELKDEISAKKVTEESIVDVSDREYNRILRKVDYRVIPILATLYLLSFLDRGSIGNANIQGMSESLGLVGQQYNWCLTIFFFPYSFTEPLCNLLLVRLKPSIWLPSIMVAWGIVMTLTGIVQNYSGLLAARFFLGLTEAGLFPGLAFYISLWYPRANAQFRLSLIFASASMAGAFSGLLAYLISMMDGIGGLEGWRWIFILEGILTVVAASFSYLLVWDEPATATFLTEEEKNIILKALNPIQTEVSMSPQLGSEQSAKWVHIKAALSDWQACAVYALSLFLPAIIKGLGYSAAIAQLLTIPVYAAATVSCVLVGYLADKTGQRSLFTVLCYGAIVVGYIIAVAPPTFMPGLTYAGCFVAACGIYPAIPGLLALSSNNWAPNAKRAIGMAIQMGFGTMGGAAASNFYRAEDAPRYRLGHILVLVFAAIGLATMVLYYLICRRLNTKREAGADSVYQYTAEQLVELGDKAPSFRYKL
ncbi:hypothetical protein N7481_007674 [Penicillium waksmanii]|uniref:uncharacterized protein n=1 Tax=Penicillium waksmanii TaxID=69791 RepID=UPI002547178F|nr:uncharacterized protein N7481_007674 [Penicillium waksmanii]KAJ5980376.1 hypothetical protein N7481_007674 [Penicillium waksmanii]